MSGAIAEYLKSWPDDRLLALLGAAEAGEVDYVDHNKCLLGRRHGVAGSYFLEIGPLAQGAEFELCHFGDNIHPAWDPGHSTAERNVYRCLYLIPIIQAEMERRAALAVESVQQATGELVGV